MTHHVNSHQVTHIHLSCSLTFLRAAELNFFFQWLDSPLRAKAASVFKASRSHSDTTHSVGRTPLDEGSARRRDLYLTTHNTQKRQASMPPAGFEPTIPASEHSQTHALDRAATGIGELNCT